MIGLPRPAARSACVLAMVALVVSAASCDRTPQLVPPEADSLAVVPDSFTVLARQAVRQWDEGADDEAASVSARVVHEALRLRPSAPWRERAQGVLDSLGLGAEVAGSDRVLVINLFSRIEAMGRTWPYLFWRSGDEVRFQTLEGAGLRLVDVATRGFGNDGSPGDSAQAAAIFDRRVGAGAQPVLMVWQHVTGGRWDLLQHLPSDSLGGTGSGEFVAGDRGVDVTTRTYKATPYFDECATCPHVFHDARYEWGVKGFRRTDDQWVPSPYATFTALVAALVAGDLARAERFVTDPALVDFARRFGWDEGGRGRWRVAPATDENALEMVFFRGREEAYRITFQARDGDWVVSGFEPTQRSLE